jgi:DNA-binding transcriptional MerR regulator
MTKALEAFRTISEVAEELDVQKHVLRFWENKFPQVRPMKRGGGRRYYRPDDLDLLRGIRFLLHREGYTIKGVQKLLREQGLEFVKSCWQVHARQPPPGPGQGPAKPGRKPRLPPEKTAGATQPSAEGGAAAKAASLLVPAAVAINRQEHIARLKALTTELEECRRILRSSEIAVGGARPQRAVK